MNKIRSFIVRHPYVSSILFPILYFVGVTILVNNIEIPKPPYVVAKTSFNFNYYLFILSIAFVWILICITVAVGKRLKITSIWVLLFIALFFIGLNIPFGSGGAKVKATTANHKEITNFMQIKFTQCSTGEASLTYTCNASGGSTTVACSTNAQGHQAALINHLKFENFRNPFTPSEKTAYASTSSRPPDGRTHINCSGNTCNVYTNTGDEVLSATVTKNGKSSYNKTSTFSGYCKGNNGYLFTAKKACYMGEEITYEEYNKLNK